MLRGLRLSPDFGRNYLTSGLDCTKIGAGMGNFRAKGFSNVKCVMYFTKICKIIPKC